MSPGSGRVDPRVDRTRIAALRAVRELLIEDGWDAVTQHRVAERSGVGRTTVYRHWPDRTGMVREAFELELGVTRDLSLTGDLRTDLVLAVEAIRFELIERVGTRILTALIARSEWDANVAATKKSLVDNALEALRTVAFEAVSAGAFEPGVDVEYVVAALVGPMVMQRLVTDTSMPTERVSKLVDAFLKAHRSTQA
jgi:AcrR family transcriptional regulator